MKWLLPFLVFLLAACTLSTPPSTSRHDWRVTPSGGDHMWKFELGHPVTSAVTATVQASAAQVTAAGLTITLDERGGCKDAKWQGILNVTSRARVWISVQDASAPGGWRRVFSGALTLRPGDPASSGNYEAVGDKYLRAAEIPVEAASSGGGQTGAGVDAGQAARALVTTARADLPHLIVEAGAAPDAGELTKRVHNGETLAAALDGILAVKSGWGWTFLPDDRLYLGPPVAAPVTVAEGTTGVRVAWRDVTSEGLRNAIRWVYAPVSGPRVVHESQDASVGSLGRSSSTRYLTTRDAEAVFEDVAATYTLTLADGSTTPGLTGEGQPHAYLRDGINLTAELDTVRTVLVTLDAPADWTEVHVRRAVGVQVQIRARVAGVTRQSTTSSGSTESLKLYLNPLPAGATIEVTQVATPAAAAGERVPIYEVNPRSLRRDRLDAAAEDLYRIPAAHAATVSVPGLQPPAGQLTVTRQAGRPDVTDRVVGTRYLIREPIRTEYIVGEPDYPTDDQVMRVLVDRRDDEAVNRAVDTVGAP